MAHRCTVCSHKETEKIENDIVQGIAHTTIADRYGLNHLAIRNHAKKHLPEKLVNAVQKKEEKHTAGILEGIQSLLNETEAIMKEARKKNHNRLALESINSQRNTFELLAKIASKLEQFRREDEQKNENLLFGNIENGLKALSDAELKALISLIGKVYKADPDHMLDPNARLIVESMENLQQNLFTEEKTKSSKKSEKSGSAGNRSARHKNLKNQGGQTTNTDELNIELDDEFDLDISDLDNSTIPSEETDPEWMIDERRDRRRHGLY